MQGLTSILVVVHAKNVPWLKVTPKSMLPNIEHELPPLHGLRILGVVLANFQV